MSIEKYISQMHTVSDNRTRESRCTSSKKGTAQIQKPAAPEVPKDTQSTEVSGISGPAEGRQEAANGVTYDVSKRTGDIAAWYQQYLIQEQEAQLSLLAAAEEEKASEEQERNPIREALDKADTLVESLKRMVERMREQQAKLKEQKASSKKKVSYSYRKVSNSISTAKTSMQASNALSSANASLSSLKRKAATGEYESKDMEIALQHAQKMVRAARKKVANLKTEALQQKRNKTAENHKKQQVNMVYHAPQRHKAEKELQQLETELKSRESQKRNANRRDEDMDLMQADMQYLRRKIDLLKDESASFSPANQQVIEDMSAAALGFISLGMKEQAIDAAQEGQTAAAQAAQTSIPV